MSLITSIAVKFWKGVKKKDLKRLSLQKPPEGISEITDIDYAAAADRARFADVYYERSSENRVTPVIFDIHGGGWYYGDKELNKIYAMHLTAGGKFKVVNISYRLAPRFTLADQLRDAACAINYFTEHAEQYGIDKNNVFVTGDSAGGCLAGMVVKASLNKAMADYYGVKALPRFKAVGFTSAAFGLYRYKKSPYYPYFAPLFRDLPMVEEYVDYCCNITADYPPAFVITGRGDFLRKENVDAADKMRAAKIPCVLRDDDGKDEKFTHVYNVCYPDSAPGKSANDAMLAFFESFLN